MLWAALTLSSVLPGSGGQSQVSPFVAMTTAQKALPSARAEVRLRCPLVCPLWCGGWSVSPAGPAPWSPTTSRMMGRAPLGSVTLVREALSWAPLRPPVVGAGGAGEEGRGFQSLGKWVSTARKGGGDGCGLWKRTVYVEELGRQAAGRHCGRPRRMRPGPRRARPTGVADQAVRAVPGQAGTRRVGKEAWAPLPARGW